MLDSFSNEIDKPIEETVFDSSEHFSSLCTNGRIKISPFAVIKYTKGWGGIMEEMVSSISRHPVEIKSLHQDFGILYVDFSSYEKHQEVKVWRAVARAQNSSKNTCSLCGEEGRLRIHGENLIIICRKCKSAKEKNGDTGTWLDNY